VLADYFFGNVVGFEKGGEFGRGANDCVIRCQKWADRIREFEMKRHTSLACVSIVQSADEESKYTAPCSS